MCHTVPIWHKEHTMTEKVNLSVDAVVAAVLTKEDVAQIDALNAKLEPFNVMLRVGATVDAEVVDDEQPKRRRKAKRGRKAKKVKKAKGPGRGRWGKRKAKAEVAEPVVPKTRRKAKRKYTRKAKVKTAAEAKPAESVAVAPRGRPAVPAPPPAAEKPAVAPGE
jgi:hypothetical protein